MVEHALLGAAIVSGRMRASSLAVVVMSFAVPAAAQATVDFQKDVRPLLSQRCFACHGPDASKRKAGLRLDVADGVDGAYRVHDGVAAIAPGDVAASELWHRVTTTDPDQRMPPPEAAYLEPLSEAEAEVLRRWIEGGAAYQTHWAFTVRRAPVPPDVDDAAWSASSIDRFVRARLDREGLSPSAEADRRTLIRRVTFDLTGLPPTRDEIAAFVADDAPDAYQRLVDRLLQSPHYGEHLARYWLDLVRFADTNGMHHDHYREHSLYRDWVIRAFADDLPYDRFVTWQLAGDLMEGDLRDGPSDDQLIASGWHRLHLIIDVGTALPEESRARNVIDRVTAFGTGFLGMTVACAQCHDHKFDPITQRDFYRLSAFFDNLDAAPETGYRSGPDFFRGAQPPYLELPSDEQRAQRDALDAQLAAIDAARAAFEAELDAALATEQQLLQQERAAADEQLQQLEAQRTALLAAMPVGQLPTSGMPRARLLMLDVLRQAIDAERAAIDAREQAAVARRDEQQQARRDADAPTTKELRKQRDDVTRAIPAAMVMKERAEPADTRLFVRGQYDQLGDPVTRGVPAFLPPLAVEGDAVPTRLDLAAWLVRPDHPLTARVAVNRYWQQCFGTGLVKTSEDFGSQGEAPSHPQLLDWLARRFVESGWSTKALLREIVLSRTYRQSSVITAGARERDPDNRLLARGSRFRMDAEMIRDQVLVSSGLWNPQMFGRSVKVPQPDGIWRAVTLPDSLPRTFVADEGEQIWRRSVYTFWKRGLPPPQMTILNAPSREFCTARRERTNTPLQALLLLNEEQYLKAARHLALTVLRDEAHDDARLARIWEAITSQLPDDEERRLLAAELRELRRVYAADAPLAEQLCDGVERGELDAATLAAWTLLASTVYNLDVTRTRQ